MTQQVERYTETKNILHRTEIFDAITGEFVASENSEDGIRMAKEAHEHGQLRYEDVTVGPYTSYNDFERVNELEGDFFKKETVDVKVEAKLWTFTRDDVEISADGKSAKITEKTRILLRNQGFWAMTYSWVRSFDNELVIEMHIIEMAIGFKPSIKTVQEGRTFAIFGWGVGQVI